MSKIISDRQWRKLNQHLENISIELREIKRKLPEKEKRYLGFSECVPPVSVCKEINSMMDGVDEYGGFLARLSDYYGCEPMGCYIDTTIDPKYKAVYRPDLKNAYTRTKTIDRATVLHEFFHHLVNLYVVKVSKSQEEHYANKFSEVFMQRANSQGGG